MFDGVDGGAVRDGVASVPFRAEILLDAETTESGGRPVRLSLAALSILDSDPFSSSFLSSFSFRGSGPTYVRGLRALSTWALP